MMGTVQYTALSWPAMPIRYAAVAAMLRMKCIFTMHVNTLSAPLISRDSPSQACQEIGQCKFCRSQSNACKPDLHSGVCRICTRPMQRACYQTCISCDVAFGKVSTHCASPQLLVLAHTSDSVFTPHRRERRLSRRCPHSMMWWTANVDRLVHSRGAHPG